MSPSEWRCSMDPGAKTGMTVSHPDPWALMEVEGKNISFLLGTGAAFPALPFQIGKLSPNCHSIVSVSKYLN